MVNNSKKTATVLSCLQVIVSIVVGFIYTPALIRVLGDGEYGLFQSIASTVGLLSILNLGINSSYIRFYSLYKKSKDELMIYKLNGLYIIVFSLIGILAFVICLFLCYHLELLYVDGLTRDEYSIAFNLMLLSALNISVSFPLGVLGMIITAEERFIYLKILNIINSIVVPLITYFLLIKGFHSTVIIIVSLLSAFINGAINIFYVVHILKHRFCFYKIPFSILKEIIRFSKYIAVNLLVDQINWNIDKIILTRIKGTISVAVYSVGYSFFTYYLLLSVSLSEVHVPFVHKLVNITDDDKLEKELTDIFVKVGRIQFIFLGLVCSGFIFFGKYFICELWLDNQYEDSYIIAILLMISSSVPFIQNIGIEIQRAENKHRFRSYLYFFVALINMVISYCVCGLYGAIGTTAVTAITIILANGLIMNIYYKKCCNVNVYDFWKSILSLSKGLIIPILFGVFISCSLHFTLLLYLCCIVIYIIIYCGSIYCFGLNSDEKRYCKNLLSRFVSV